MKQRRIGTTILALGVALALALVPLAAAGTISNTTIENQIIMHERIRNVDIDDSRITESSIGAASVSDSSIEGALLFAAHAEETYFDEVSIIRASLEDSRATRAKLAFVGLDDVTLCRALVLPQLYRTGDTCVSVSTHNGAIVEHAKLVEDAPATVGPGASYDIVVRDAQAQTLTVQNDPGGLVGLNFETEFDPLGLQSTGFIAAADPSSVESLELVIDGEVVATFGLGETVDLPDDDFTLRVNVAQQGLVDGSRLGLQLHLDDHTLRPAITSLEVVATQLAFLPEDQQPFAPFFADNLARLVGSVGTDEFGNVDRDLSIAVTVQVNSVDSEGVDVEEIDEQAYLHDDSRLFSANPFLYMEPTVTAAHHPQTLELLVRQNFDIDVDYGTIGFYGTHLVGQSPFAKNITLFGEATNANGETLNAQIDLTMPETNEEQQTVTFFGKDFTLPGEGTLVVNLVDGDGDPVTAEDDWELFIQETPTSHQTELVVDLDAGQATVTQELAESVQIGTPFGNFVPSAYMVCIDHDGERDCALAGELVNIKAGETTTVDIVIE